MTRVAFIVSKFPCYDEAFILREMHAFSKRMEIDIFSLRKSKDKIIHDQARELAPHTTYVPYFFSWRVLTANVGMLFSRPWRYLTALARLIFGNLRSPQFLIKGLIFFPKSVYLAAWIQKRGVSHIHAYWATYPASAALVASELTGVPFSFTGHAHDIYVDVTHLPEKMRRATFVSTCTVKNRDYLLSLTPRPAPEKVLVNYHGLMLDHFAVNGKKRNEVFQILSVGTLHYYKGFNYFLNALKALKDKGLHFHATIVGGGPLQGDLKKHIRLLGLESCITMTGPLKQAEVIPYYKKADLFVLMAQPEWHWGIPNVLIEALAAKTPAITTRFGSVEELVQDGKTGLLVGARDAEGLAQAIERLYRDEDFRSELAQIGNYFVTQHFDLDRNIKTFMERFSHEDARTLVA